MQRFPPKFLLNEVFCFLNSVFISHPRLACDDKIFHTVKLDAENRIEFAMDSAVIHCRAVLFLLKIISHTL